MGYQNTKCQDPLIRLTISALCDVHSTAPIHLYYTHAYLIFVYLVGDGRAWVLILSMLFSTHQSTLWVNWLIANSLKHRSMDAFMVVYALPSTYSQHFRENWIARYGPKANAFKEILSLPAYVLPTYISLTWPERDFSMCETRRTSFEPCA